MVARSLLALFLTLSTPSSASATSSSSSSSSSSSTTFSLAPIGAATTNSPTFALVAGAACNSSVVEVIYGVYLRNRNLFDACVADSEYRIFPYAGASPTRSQIGAMVDSPSCVAILTAVAISGVPECDLTSLPVLAAAESVVKVAVDVQAFPTQRALTVPSSERFHQMMIWRRDSNLASEAGLPCDSDSQLFGEYAANLAQATTNSTVRLLSDLTVEYRLANGTVIRGSGLDARSARSSTSGSAASGSDSASTSGLTPNQVEGYVTVASGEKGGEEEISTEASGAPHSWDWYMAFVVVALSMVRLALPLV